MTVMVPFSNAANIGLRRVTKDREISRILSYLANGWNEVSSDWKIRFKENTIKMQSGDLSQAAEVFKGLLQIHVEKPLSFREKKMLERARHMLVAEISISRGVSEVHAVAMLQRALEKSRSYTSCELLALPISAGADAFPSAPSRNFTIAIVNARGFSVSSTPAPATASPAFREPGKPEKISFPCAAQTREESSIRIRIPPAP